MKIIGFRKVLFCIFFGLLIAALVGFDKYDEIANDGIKFLVGAYLFGNVASKVAPSISNLKIATKENI